MLTRRLQLQGTSMIEVLVTIVILAFGLLGLAGFLVQIQNTELESYQRAQALTLLNDMIERINIHRANAASYASTDTLGTGDSFPASCADEATYPTGSAVRDQCEWSNALKGSAEVKGTQKIGAIEGARGCITQVQAPNPAAGVCSPGVYRVAVAWQGRSPTATPTVACGAGLYGSNDKFRRVISSQVSVALLNCL